MRPIHASPGSLCALALLMLGACSSSPSSGGGSAGTRGGAGSPGDAGSSATAGTTAGGRAGTTGTAGGGAGATAGAAGTSVNGDAGTTGAAGNGGAGAAGGGGAGGGIDAGAGGMGGFGFMGASRCPASDARLCESFENGLDALLWTTVVNGEATVTIDDTRAFRGTKSLHVKVINAGHKAAISESRTFPLPNNVLFARMFVWFDTFTATARFTMMEAPQDGANAAWIRFGGQFGKYGVGTDHGASGDWLQPDTEVVPTKRWTCIEVELKSDTNEFHVWQDEVERTALNVGAKQHTGFAMPTFTSIWFGWQTYSNQAPAEFWLDEIAVDTKRIGCAN